MTNRDKLFKLCTYDMLRRINNGLLEVNGGDVCVVDALNKRRVHSLFCVEKTCDKCILEWLDKDANSNK